MKKTPLKTVSISRGGGGDVLSLIFLLLAFGCSNPEVSISTPTGEAETGPFTVKVADGISTVVTEEGWEKPFIVISKVGGADVTDDTPTPIKVNAGTVITLTVTVPEAYIVTNLKIINSGLAPSKTSGDNVNPATYTFKVTGTSTISGQLTPKDPDALIGINAMFVNTLQELRIAQGELAVKANVPSNVRSLRNGNDTGDGGNDTPTDTETESVFDEEITAYTATVPFSGYPAVVTATPSESEAGVEIDIPQIKTDGVYKVRITVTAPFWKLYPNYTPSGGDPALPDGAAGNKTKTYTIDVTREAGSGDTSLSSISSHQTALTNEGGNVYAGTVSANISGLQINAAAAHSNAKVQVVFNGETKPADINNAANSISTTVSGLEEGANTITVKVTAEDGETNAEYAVKIFKEVQSEDTKTFNASGGAARLQEIDGILYEIHTFAADDETALGG
ncbi:MAG: cadherin-like beta sandwich domain-containing protein, partial [Spirochaetaceae bacterium]|nr:cadherin-like beta sandwich domain-containing protein [Spirochaetaceae bacterium]